MTNKLPDELHCQAEAVIHQVGKTELAVRMGEIAVRDKEGNLIQTIPAPAPKPGERFSDRAKTR